MKTETETEKMGRLLTRCTECGIPAPTGHLYVDATERWHRVCLDTVACATRCTVTARRRGEAHAQSVARALTCTCPASRHEDWPHATDCEARAC